MPPACMLMWPMMRLCLRRDEAREMFFFGFDNYLKHGLPKVFAYTTFSGGPG